MMAGIAILLMIPHHLFAWQLALKDSTPWQSILGEIGDFATIIFSKYGKVCVNIFAITSGYVLIANPKAYTSLKSRLIRLSRFLVGYWLAILLFIIIGALNNDLLPTLPQLLANMFGLLVYPTQPWVNVIYAWYVTYYIEFILLVPILLWMYNGHSFIKDLIITLSITLTVNVLVPLYIAPSANNEIIRSCLINLHPLSSSCFGIVVAKYELFDKVHRMFGQRHNICILLLMSILSYACGCILLTINPLGGARWNSFTDVILSILAVAIMYLIIELLVRISSKYLKRALKILGKYSLYLWFLHGIFRTGKHFFETQLYSLGEPILIIAATIIMLLPFAYIIDKFVSYIFSLRVPSRIRRIRFISNQ
jgi:peptidoglycan/LPS O-acetylase OafA/YrhL